MVLVFINQEEQTQAKDEWKILCIYKPACLGSHLGITAVHSHGKYPWTLVILPHRCMHIFIQITCRRRHKFSLTSRGQGYPLFLVFYTHIDTIKGIVSESRGGIFKVINRLQGKICKSNVMIYMTETLRSTNKTKGMKSTCKIIKNGCLFI